MRAKFYWVIVQVYQTPGPVSLSAARTERRLA